MCNRLTASILGPRVFGILLIELVSRKANEAEQLRKQTLDK